MRTELLEQLEYLKTCKGTPGSPYEHLGTRIYDQIKNLLKQKDIYITHVYIPRGSEQQATALNESFKKIFNESLSPALTAFYTCFNGLEFRYINARKMWEEEKDELDIDWEFFCDDHEALSYDDLFKDEYQELKEEFFINLDIDEESSPFNRRLSDPTRLLEYSYYGESLEAFEYGKKKLIPPYDFLFHPENAVRHLSPGDRMYFFDYYSDFYQALYGRKDGELSFWGAEDYAADISKYSDKNIEKKLLGKL